MMMRVTNNMMSQNVMNNIQTAQERLTTLQNQSSSGVGISKPSDDPSAVQQIIRLRNNISNVEQYKSNASEASSYMSTIDGALGRRYFSAPTNQRTSGRRGQWDLNHG